MGQGVQLLYGRRPNAVKAYLAVGIFGENAIEKQHVEVNVEIQRRAKTLNQCHRTGLYGYFGKSSNPPTPPPTMTILLLLIRRSQIEKRSKVARKAMPTAVSTIASADSNPFATNQLTGGYDLANYNTNESPRL